MTALLPLTPPVATPPPKRSLRRSRAVTVVTATLVALLLTALLNADQLVTVAKRLPFGQERSVAVALANADHAVSHALWLDRPRSALDRLFGHAPATSPALPTPPAPVPTPTAPAPNSTPTPGNSPAQARPTSAHPLRVLFGGDSVADQVAEAFTQLGAATHVVRVDDQARISTGLTRPDYFNWPAQLTRVLAGKRPPQVVILMFGANDIQPIMTRNGPASVGTAKWLAEYRNRVAATMAMLAGSDADVYWVGQPLMRSQTFAARIGQIDDIYASEAAKYDGITFVDTRPVLADAHGRYADYLAGSGGKRELVRASDGVHLTMTGARRIAHAVLAAVGKHWQLPS